ncbi:MAG: Ribosomal RNA small subunit methyltransferase H [uncultured bacterium (gcode 4)]|uniref:Ribosomal RNA small subunit methyltransferase H n=1 Tax=uncultured bacterium (gcode 4) TaxID=1234023 RepID=K2G020_9BACT|nr:MAG: Ribosomal RNA small subunit methyltransferase H [uncultured bacterium (gcode 4)]
MKISSIVFRVFNIFLTILAIQNPWHIPVLYHEILEGISLFQDKQNIVVDATLWLWWHAIWILSKMNKGDVFIAFDADLDNLRSAQENIEASIWNEIKNKNITIHYIHSNFRFLSKNLSDIWVDKITHIYYDFWVNSVHYDNAEKWFSFRLSWPLDLRYDRSSWITAKDVVNTYDEQELRKIFYSYWEEKKTPFIVEAILKARKISPISTTDELADIIQKSSFDPKSKTRVFQALRIEVNDEFWSIRDSLKDAIGLLEVNWIIECITFHSLEDRIVKEIFSSFCTEEIDDFTGQTIKTWIAKKITKKPIIPTEKEIEANPRSRSAKLRIIQKIRTI